jgi:hypothetical protein
VPVIAAVVPFVPSMALCALLAHCPGYRIGSQVPVVMGLLLVVAVLDRDLSGPLMVATEAATAEPFARTI